MKKDQMEKFLKGSLPRPDGAITPDMMECEVCSVDGSWFEEIRIDKKPVWNFGSKKPFKLFDTTKPLPSDSRFRKDLIIWKTKDQKLAQKAKEELEELQRKDAKIREALGPKSSH